MDSGADCQARPRTRATRSQAITEIISNAFDASTRSAQQGRTRESFVFTYSLAEQNATRLLIDYVSASAGRVPST